MWNPRQTWQTPSSAQISSNHGKSAQNIELQQTGDPSHAPLKALVQGLRVQTCQETCQISIHYKEMILDHREHEEQCHLQRQEGLMRQNINTSVSWHRWRNVNGPPSSTVFNIGHSATFPCFYVSVLWEHNILGHYYRTANSLRNKVAYTKNSKWFKVALILHLRQRSSGTNWLKQPAGQDHQGSPFLLSPKGRAINYQSPNSPAA